MLERERRERERRERGRRESRKRGSPGGVYVGRERGECEWVEREGV